MFCDFPYQLSCVGAFSKKRLCGLEDFSCNTLYVGSSEECDHLSIEISSSGLILSILFFDQLPIYLFLCVPKTEIAVDE